MDTRSALLQLIYVDNIKVGDIVTTDIGDFKCTSTDPKVFEQVSSTRLETCN